MAAVRIDDAGGTIEPHYVSYKPHRARRSLLGRCSRRRGTGYGDSLERRVLDWQTKGGICPDLVTLLSREPRMECGCGCGNSWPKSHDG